MTSAVKGIVIMALMITHLAHANISIRFQPRIKNDAKTLGDIVIISNDTHHWSTLTLASHPLAGEWITRDTLLTWLTDITGHKSWQWQGKTRIRVNIPKTTSGLSLEDKAKTALIEQLSHTYQKIMVTSVSTIKNNHDPIESFKPYIKLSWPVAKRVVVWLKNDKQQIAVWFKVQAYYPVLVANNTIPAHRLLINTMFHQKINNIAGFTAAPITTLPSHCWLTTKLLKDAVLLDNQLADIPLIHKNQTIKVRFNRNNVSIFMDGIAQEDANINQIIPIINPQNKHIIRAKIISSKQAEAIL